MQIDILRISGKNSPHGGRKTKTNNVHVFRLKETHSEIIFL